jgi:ribonuclease III
MDIAGWVARTLDFRFSDEALPDLALTHRSASTSNNERLEFLGDAVLGLIVSRAIFERRPDADEGTLSRIRARLVRRETLAEIAAALDLGGQVRLGMGEMRTGGHQRSSILANGLEALIGAIYLDGGMAEAERIVLALYAGRLADLPRDADLADPKTRLQEWLQARGLPPPQYDLKAVQGAAHAQRFEVLCAVAALGLSVPGAGASRRAAEQSAAEATMRSLETSKSEP